MSRFQCHPERSEGLLPGRKCTGIGILRFAQDDGLYNIISGKPMLSLDEYLREAEVAHGHLCAGQVLGVRLAMLGLEKLGIEDPRGKDRKRLVTFVEIDRCATDAIAVVTGCRLGKRALKFRDWGKMAATFVDLGIKDVNTGKAIRIAAKESSKALARSMHPEIESKNQQQMLAYREMSEDDLFTKQWVQVDLRGRISRVQRRAHRLCRVWRRD
jgi:formylmethanofuran dehydrogenase subunit E